MGDRISLSNFLLTLASRLIKKFHAYLIGFGGFLLTAIGFLYFDLGSSIPLIKGYLFLIGVILFALILAIIEVNYDFYKDSKILNFASITRVRRACPPSLLSPNPDAKVGLILDPSERFHQDDLVSIVYKTGIAELHIGYGNVLNIHEHNKMIQIEVLYISRTDILQKLLSNDNEYLERIEVRPNISRRKLEEYAQMEVYENGRSQ